jgi:hypothetical protein
MSQRIVRFEHRNVRPGQFAPTTPSQSPTVVLLTAVWGRLAVTDVWYRGTRRVAAQWNAAGIKTRIVVGGDQPEHRELAAQHGAEWVETPNRPLGRKWNNICETASKTGEMDYIFVLGSDDLVSPAMAAAYIPVIQAGTPYAGVQACMFFQVSTGKLFNFSQLGVTVGCGRLLHANLMRRVGMRPWIDTKERGLDNSMDIRTLRGRVLTHKMDWNAKQFLVDIKTQENIWSYTRLRSVKPNEPDLEAERFMSLLPEWESIKALATQPTIP